MNVYLVGAGSGDPELMTVRGYRLVCAADCIVHDRLIPAEMLSWAKPSAKLINVGKSPTKKRFPQSEINRILIEEAKKRQKKGQTVVRLKGGDPFVFGLGGDECIALAEAGIPYEIVPGVSAVSAVPAYAGIPITHRGLASSVVVLSGHSLDGDAWHNLPRTGSIVVLMGVGRLAQIVELVKRVRPSTTPVAIIQSGTTPSQQTVVGTLETVVTLATDVAPPAIIVIGDVVHLRDQLAWFVAGRASEKDDGWLPAATQTY